jgi:hypothetical protein
MMSYTITLARPKCWFSLCCFAENSKTCGSELFCNEQVQGGADVHSKLPSLDAISSVRCWVPDVRRDIEGGPSPSSPGHPSFSLGSTSALRVPPLTVVQKPTQHLEGGTFKVLVNPKLKLGCPGLEGEDPLSIPLFTSATHHHTGLTASKLGSS